MRKYNQSDVSPVHSDISAVNVGGLSVAQDAHILEADVANLATVGIHFTPDYQRGLMEGYTRVNQDVTGFDNAVESAAMDAGLAPAVLPQNVPSLVQFNQTWMPGHINVLKAPRLIDTITGVKTAGDWADEQVVYTIMEHSGETQPYSDTTNVQVGDYTVSFDGRTIVRRDNGIQVGILEQERSAKIRISDSAEKRNAAMMALEISRNLIGFNGYNDGAGATYGFLNDPGLGAYLPLKQEGGDTEWDLISYKGIVDQFVQLYAQLQAQSNGIIDPATDATTIVIGPSRAQYLNNTSVNGALGFSVLDYLKKTYPRSRVVVAPQMDAANGGENVIYIFADNVADSGTDGGNTWEQVVPSRYRALGVQQLTKGYKEAYSNATAGCILKRPFANVRGTGI